LLTVQVRGALVGLHRRTRLVGLEVEVANAVVHREIGDRVIAGLELADRLEVDLDGPPPFFLLFVLPGGFLQLLEVHPPGGVKGWSPMLCRNLEDTGPRAGLAR